MSSFEDFQAITRFDEPLAPHTWMKLGGTAQFLVEPRDHEELSRVIRYCHEQQIPARLLGGGSNILVRDEGVGGAVLRLTSDAFCQTTVEGTLLTAGAGCLLSSAISQAVKSSLAGLESLVGIPGTVGGALHGNAGGRNGDIGQFVSKVKVLTATGEIFERSENELSFAYRFSSVNELCILETTFQLKTDDPDAITQRMRKLWIMKKASQPLSSQSAGCIFRNPRGLSAGALVDQAGLKGTRIGKAEVSDRHANFIVTDEGCSSDDVLRLIDLVQSKVSQQFGVDLEVEIDIW